VPLSSNYYPPPSARSSEDLTGLNILLVEDAPDVGDAVKKLLELLGATVAGPAPTMGAAESLIAERLPDVALPDFHLRGGERSDGLIARMRQQFEFPPPPSLAGTTILEKPVSEAVLLAHLGPLAIKANAQ
jgi:CheY-like chemotaxis protein